MSRELVVLLGDATVGRLQRSAAGRVSFTYEDAWREAPSAYPLSLSMPLAIAQHGAKVAEPFLWGLVPDSELILQRWSERFQVSPRNVFALLTHVGEDCAGAVRIVTPERVGELLGEDDGDVDWLEEGGVAQRLRLLRRDGSAWRKEDDHGQFSLAGAQPKTALLHRDGRWGVPSGRIATTHILKPGIEGLDAQAENEHFCLTLGRELGLPVARTSVQRFEGEVAIVVERYDRIVHASRVVRVHQEDLCQALAVHPARKYESEGGPGAKGLARLLREHSLRPTEDVETLVDALAFNWLVGGTDAHAKNYSLLIGAGGRIRLAPLYDVASALPYEQLQRRKLKLAMKLAGTYRLWDVGRHEWTKVAAEVGLDGEVVVARVLAMADGVPDAAADVRARAVDDGLDATATRRLADSIAEWARRCAARLRGEGTDLERG